MAGTKMGMVNRMMAESMKQPSISMTNCIMAMITRIPQLQDKLGHGCVGSTGQYLAEASLPRYEKDHARDLSER
jgi:hypothetical protein